MGKYIKKFDKATKAMYNWFDIHEGRKAGSSIKNIEQEFIRQGYKPRPKTTSINHPFKGYTIANKYASKEDAKTRAIQLRNKFNHVKIHKGTINSAHGNTRTVYRVLVK